MCERWADEFERRYAAARARGSGSGELDPGNVLAAAREPWLVIDPKPHAGDPAYDPLQHMLNFPARLAGDPGGFAGRMAGLLGLDAGRLRSWLFARCVQGWVGAPYLRAAVVQLAP